MRHSWTDDRLDDLSRTMVERFDRAEQEASQRFSRFEGAMDRRFGEIDRRFGEMDQRFSRFEGETDQRFNRVKGDMREVRDQLAGLQRAIIQVGGGLIAANLTLVVGIFGLIVSRI